MKCPEVRAFLHPFLDGELEVEKNVVVLQHLELCGCCRSRFEDEKRFLGRVAQGCCERTPLELRSKLAAALDCAGPPVAAPRRLRRALVAAVVFFAAGASVWAIDPFCLRGCHTVRDIARHYWKAHSQDAEVKPGPDPAAFYAQIGIDPPTLPVNYEPSKIRGGTCDHCCGCNAKLVCFRLPCGTEAAWVCLPRQRVHPWLEKTLADGREYYVAHQDGVRFVGWEDDHDEVVGFVAPESIEGAEQQLIAFASDARR